VKRDREFVLFGLGVDEKSFRGIGLLFFIYFGAIAFSALISPWVYHGILGIAKSLPEAWSGADGFTGKLYEMFQYLSGKSYADYFDRLRWLPLLILLPWLIRYCGLMSWQVLGVSFKGKGLGFLRSGFLIGVILVGIIILGQVLNIPVVERKEITIGRVIEVVLLSMASGCLLGLLEEIIFRGLVFRVFYTCFSPLFATVASALFFAYCHFKFPEFLWSEGVEVTWKSGIYVGVWTALGFLKQFDWVVFTNLFLLGFLLIQFVLNKKSLMMSVGIHGGIVFGMLGYKRLYILQDEGDFWFWGSGKMTDGLACMIILFIMNLIFFYYEKRRLSIYYKSESRD
jgi:membrane protease YdiL (CAAX protease family)